MKNQFLYALVFWGCCMVFSNCSISYDCMLYSSGNTPDELTYYVNVIPGSSDISEAFDPNEPAQELKNRLNEIGYIESDSINASLCINLTYYIGEREYMGSSGNTISNSYTVSKEKSSSKTDGKVKVDLSKDKISGSSSTKTQTKEKTNEITFSNSSSTPLHFIPAICKITAMDNQNKKTIWTVKMTDDVGSYINYVSDREAINKLRQRLPWMIYVAQRYIGKKTYETRIRIKESEGKKHGLKSWWNSNY